MKKRENHQIMELLKQIIFFKNIGFKYKREIHDVFTNEASQKVNCSKVYAISTVCIQSVL